VAAEPVLKVTTWLLADFDIPSWLEAGLADATITPPVPRIVIVAVV
jgi:hypothetical protein